MHLEAARFAAIAGKAVMCTKPLGRNAEEAREMPMEYFYDGYIINAITDRKKFRLLNMLIICSSGPEDPPVPNNRDFAL